MKIGFDISQTGSGKAGCGYFAENLIRNLSLIDTHNTYTLYPSFGDHFWDDKYTQTININAPNFKKGLTHSSLDEAKNFWNNDLYDFDEALGNVDILHSNNFFCPIGLKKTKLIYTLYDLSFVDHPDCTTEHNRIACFESVFKASLYADLIISISDYTKNHFLKLFPHYPKNRIFTSYPGNRFSNYKIISKKPERLENLESNTFWLNVGTLEPRKNIMRILNVYSKLVSENKHFYPLVFAGKPGWLLENLHTIIQKLNLEKHVYILGYVNDMELKWLYENCFSLLFPSLFEGFGLPVLEALTFGIPIITSNISSLPEVAGKAALLIDPLNESNLYNAMIEIATNQQIREELKFLAFDQAKKFSWKKTSADILELYKETYRLPDMKTSTNLVIKEISQ